MGVVSEYGNAIHATPAQIAVLIPIATLALGITYILWTCIYNLFFHPLRNYPGPKHWALSYFFYGRVLLSGQAHRIMLEIHNKYGPVVRVSPSTVCYSHPDAMPQIRGHRKSGNQEHQKDPFRYEINRDNILGADRFNHGRYRRSLANGFSHQAMLDQELIIRKYVDELFEQLLVQSDGGSNPVDIVRWFNYTTFDIIGDLSFGQPFGCLQDTSYHPMVALMFNSVKNIAYASVLQRWPLFYKVLQRFVMPRGLATKFAENRDLCRQLVEKRLELGSDRPDFMSSMLKKRNGADELSFKELTSAATVLVIAGSETTATALSAAAFFLSHHRAALARLSHEVRTAFQSEDEITLTSVQNLPYLLAVINEAMRLYPAAPTSQPREIGEGGDSILGRYVSEGTTVEVWQWVLYHNPAYWHRPEEFLPERWLGDPEFADDRRDSFQPFSVGPRNCIGKNLAYSEMRLILTRLVWKFDLTLADDSRGWDVASSVYILYQKGPCNIYLTPRNRKMDGGD